MRPIWRLLAAACLCGVVVLLPVLRSLAQGSKPLKVITRGPYLQMGTPESMTVVWRTESKINPTIRYGTEAGKLDRTASGKTAVTVRVSPDQADEYSSLARLFAAPKHTFQFEVLLEDLHPDTKYYYAVYDGEKKLAGGDETYHFYTNPPSGKSKPLRIWVVGDSGTGGKPQAKVHTAMQRFTAKQKHPIDIYVHVGDMAYSDGTDDQFQNNFFKVYEPTMRNVVCWPAMGNHEGHTSKGSTGVGPYYDGYVLPTKAEAGGVASGTEAYYSFDYGDVHLVCLDSHDLDRSPTAAMGEWLKTDLEKTKAQWLIAYWHHPPYTKGTHDSDKEVELVEMRENIMPILESGGVDLVLTGHSHIYERSMLMDGAYATPTVAENVIFDDGDGDPRGDGAYKKNTGLHPHEGTVQVVAGHGGADMGRLGTMPVMKRIIVEHGSVIVDVDGDTLKAVMVNRDAQQRDLFALVKQGSVMPKRIANPKQPAPVATAKPRPPKPVGHKSEPPKRAEHVIDQNSDWEYLAGADPEGDWTVMDYPVDDWKTGAAGFGYGNEDDVTVLADMPSHYSTVYLRKDFDVGTDEPLQEVGLAINYRDGFIAYLNGKEVLRVGVGQGCGKQAQSIAPHEPEGYVYFPLKGADQLLRKDDNILAIEGHSADVAGGDFTLDPYLVVLKKAKETEPKKESESK